MRPQEYANGDQIECVSVLVALSDREQQDALEDLLNRSRWHVVCANGAGGAIAAMQKAHVGVVIVSYSEDVKPTWREVVNAAQRTGARPAVIVTGASTDEFRCTEVLEGGGYDFLPQPFEAREAFFMLSAAWQFWRQHNPGTMAASTGFAA